MKRTKTLVMVLIVLVGLRGVVQAQTSEVEREAPEPITKWTFLQIGFLPTVPGATKTSNVYGLKFGFPMVAGHGRVYGMEPSFFYSGTNYVGGAQGAWIGASVARNVDGIQAAGGVCMNNEMNGLMPSIVNINKIMRGYQPGFVNITGELTGFQSGFVNVAKEECTGFQLGCVNYSKEGSLIQIGALNIIKDGWLPFFPIINLSF